MPLKHKTETRLIVLLGVVLAITGVVVALLPAIPAGTVPWVIAFVISIAYPVSLYSLFRRRRADNEFRLLHWFPAAMLVVWLILSVIGYYSYGLEFLASLYSWAWTLPFVALGFFLLIAFCLHVIRCRVSRITILAIIFLSYSVAALINQQTDMNFNNKITTIFKDQKWIQWIADLSEKQTTSDVEEITTERISISDNINLEPSEDLAEEEWRSSLRAVAERENEDFSLDNFVFADEVTIEEDIFPPELEPDGSGAYMREVVTTPRQLPDSGFGLGAIAMLMMAGYCGTLHQRARKRRIQ